MLGDGLHDSLVGGKPSGCPSYLEQRTVNQIASLLSTKQSRDPMRKPRDDHGYRS